MLDVPYSQKIYHCENYVIMTEMDDKKKENRQIGSHFYLDKIDIILLSPISLNFEACLHYNL